ncbi:bifunctional [glutamate--ammonia ligase]-adenylyl-L-tyrosine phosphorylase/[glutamate--ammonia-ligase] adenylyltransferase [Marinomonas sp. M1K-6]|uniref:Bifunctional glutamine synthetase adenylyltransferase/adenylyl-removing enzyme n=1 Tax=Marinomonas profundi TaxID=2726122 RepID=A0A847RA64_9GAMM|nr:bifunctional [glutamate--ammonia ligase]-adenylyl-L-tyrosine phosphorylase/[glutamate--ammonia-ligase] adenylyltransferase [Marinomonas profundi]NLQ18936.1 bifunctional [glutamate--ammonia ligase]-adenylyl-L-tyrosine phosphorylase/[glutamate--ammonia-ligase] adenylyltransferase [Marinomonas profundi]UDV02324.1 bifunctional [glutamate--ammonia ligase]-adenylyl-L-tyrosine phosphorylase/[glutamate--ammonia-ligase] adenylyltransferase [Marinomonas profundi]
MTPPNLNPSYPDFCAQSTTRFLLLEQVQEARERHSLAELNTEQIAVLEPLWILSHYLHQQFIRFPHWLDDVWGLDTLPERPSKEALLAGEVFFSHAASACLQAPLEALDEASFIKRLRLYRQWWMVRLIALDIQQKLSLTALTSRLSGLADACVNASLQWSEQHYLGLYGRALDSEGLPQSMIVIGMGKLGGNELNLSSDIDLIFAFREHGDTQGGKKSLSHQEYFTKLGQKLIQHLDQVTADGFVFRVDMRLRPFGQSGALVLNMDSLENYYQDQGRDWERYAMIKARVMSGNALDVREFEALRKPFVYRKYLDFGAIGALRDLKQMIAKEVRRKGIEHNIKLGEGGIREVEFIAQALQILHGGRDQGLQTPALLKVLPYLAQHDYLPVEEMDQLREAYLLLRRTEHALQAVNDEQTQLLPEDDNARLRIALIVGFSSWQALEERLWQVRKNVHRAFVALIDDGEENSEEVKNQDMWRLLIKHPEDTDAILDAIESIAWQDQDASVKRISQRLSSRTVVFMQPIGQERLAIFLAALMAKLEDEANPDLVLERVFPILEAVLRRTAYLVLLCENQTALTHLIRLCRESVWFTEAISTTPALLDELLDANTLFLPPDKAMLVEELQQILLRLPENDEEAQMDAMRRFRLSIILRIAACDITEILPVMKVSDHLTWLAEVLLEQVLQQSWQYLTKKHGFPVSQGEVAYTPQLAIIGYGKSGGWELGYDSDLDLVFVHDAQATGSTDGERSLDNLTFYTRLGQRLIHMITSFTAAGRLYEVDMRLRPSGNSGLLVSSLESFRDYQQKEAWVWEHQALTRSRGLAGEPTLLARFEACRKEIIASVRDRAVLKAEVIKMREKMRGHLDTGGKEKGFDLKQGAGGIIDIEFMVQYLVLAWSYKYPELMRFSDNVRQLEAAAAVALLDADQAGKMTDTYTLYRSLTHRLSLQQQGRVVQNDALVENQSLISQYWERFVKDERL